MISRERGRRGTSGSSGRTKPCRIGSTRSSSATSRQWDADDRSRTISGWRRKGACWKCSANTSARAGWKGYLLTGRHGLFNTYEAFTHIVDSMFNQHAKWLKVTRGAAVAAADRLAQLPARQPRLAAGSQRLHASGSRVHRSRVQQESGSRPRVSAAGRELPLERDGPLPPQPALRQHRRRRQAPGAAVARHGRARSGTARRASASGTGRATTKARNPIS